MVNVFKKWSAVKTKYNLREFVIKDVQLEPIRMVKVVLKYAQKEHIFGNHFVLKHAQRTTIHYMLAWITAQIIIKHIVKSVNIRKIINGDIND